MPYWIKLQIRNWRVPHNHRRIEIHVLRIIQRKYPLASVVDTNDFPQVSGKVNDQLTDHVLVGTLGHQQEELFQLRQAINGKIQIDSPGSCILFQGVRLLIKNQAVFH